MPEINYWAILVCGVVSMVIGMIWYGPIFGKKWMEITGLSKLSKEEQMKMMKSSRLLYLVSFLLALFQAWILAYYIDGWKDASGLENALWIWAAFVIPTVAGGTMWTAEARNNAWARFLIQGGYYLVLFIVFGLILGLWR